MTVNNQFIVSAGMKTPRGKPTYPNFMRVLLSRKDALEILSNLAHQLSLDRSIVEIPLFGNMSKGDRGNFDGKDISPTHKVLTKNRGWVEFRHLAEGDELIKYFVEWSKSKKTQRRLEKALGKAARKPPRENALE